ncbi:hypothetical protein Y717_14700, partial [Streptomyces scopuliridis RB72]
ERLDGVEPLPIRRSILELWNRAEAVLRGLGASVRRVRFPVVEHYEGRRHDTPGLVALGYLPADWDAFELSELVSHGWSAFLAENALGAPSLRDFSPYQLRPDAPGSVDARLGATVHPGRDTFDYAEVTRSPDAGALASVAVKDRLDTVIRGLVSARHDLFEAWMDAEGIDVVAFPANGNIGAWDADINESSAAIAWQDGAVFSTMNHVMRRLGIPSVTTPMGVMADTRMPVGITFCGRAYSDPDLIRIAHDYERAAAVTCVPGIPAPAHLAPRRTRRDATHASGESRSLMPPEVTLQASARVDDTGDVLVTVRAEVSAGAESSGTVRIVGRLKVDASTITVTGPVTEATVRIEAAVRRARNLTRSLVHLVLDAPDGGVWWSSCAEVPFVRSNPLAVPTAAPHQEETWHEHDDSRRR